MQYWAVCNSAEAKSLHQQIKTKADKFLGYDKIFDEVAEDFCPRMKSLILAQ